MHFFLIFYEHAELNQFVSVTLHCFLHSLRCSRAVSYIELLYKYWYCWGGDIVIKQAQRLHEQYW